MATQIVPGPGPAHELHRLRISPEDRQPVEGPRFALILGASAAVAVALLVTVLLGVWPRDRQGEEAASPPQAAKTGAPVSPLVPAEASAGGAVVAGGRVEASGRRELAAPRGGVVSRVFVQRGSRVKAGDVLLELDAAEDLAQLRRCEAALRAARARLDELKEGARPEELDEAEREAQAAAAAALDAAERAQIAERLERSGAAASREARERALAAEAARARADGAKARRDLLKRGARRTTLAAAEAEVARAQADVAAAQARVDRTQIVSPIDAVVLDVRVRTGEAVAIEFSPPPIVIADAGRLTVVADVPEARAMQLAVGDPADITVEALPSHRFHGRVVEIAPEADRQKATLEVTVSFDDPAPAVRPRMAARVAIHPGKEPP